MYVYIYRSVLTNYVKLVSSGSDIDRTDRYYESRNAFVRSRRAFPVNEGEASKRSFRGSRVRNRTRSVVISFVSCARCSFRAKRTNVLSGLECPMKLNVVGSRGAAEEIQSSAKVGRLSSGSVRSAVALIPSMRSSAIGTGTLGSGILQSRVLLYIAVRLGHKLLQFVDQVPNFLRVLLDAAQLLLVEVRRDLRAQDDLRDRVADLGRACSGLEIFGHVHGYEEDQVFTLAEFAQEQLDHAEQMHQVRTVHGYPDVRSPSYLWQYKLGRTFTRFHAISTQSSDLLP